MPREEHSLVLFPFQSVVLGTLNQPLGFLICGSECEVFTSFIVPVFIWPCCPTEFRLTFLLVLLPGCVSSSLCLHTLHSDFKIGFDRLLSEVSFYCA